MRTLKIEVSESIYEHIIFFLRNLPKNLIRVSDDKEVVSYKNNNNIKKRVEELFNSNNIQTFQNIKDPLTWQKSVRDEWE
jgi:hypothetical protein